MKTSLPQSPIYFKEKSVIWTFVLREISLLFNSKAKPHLCTYYSVVTTLLLVLLLSSPLFFSPMALRIALSSSPSFHPTPSQWSSSSSSSTSSVVPTRYADWSGSKRGVSSAISMEKRRGSSVVVRCSLEATQNAAAAVAVEGQVTEVTKDTFWPIVKAAGDKVVVLDMYTQWCGPCKIIAPKFQELSEKYLDVVFLKLDCNQDNKPLAKELGIKVVPTFKILKNGKIVKEITGAKMDDLVYAIDTTKSN